MRAALWKELRMGAEKRDAAARDGWNELVQYKERFCIALQCARICVFEVDLTRQLYTFFENAECIFGISGERILREVQPFSALPPAEYLRAASDYFSHPDDAAVIDAAFRCILAGNPTTYQARMKAGSTEFIWCKLDVSPIIEGGKPVRMVGVITDISELKAKNELLEKAVRLDGFTGLYTKKHAEWLICDTLAKRADQQHALILFDLDDFKAANDTYGHLAGDEVLSGVAKNLRELFRKTDIIGRFGGDEFLILLKDMQSKELLVSKLTALLRTTDNAYGVTKSIGVSLFPGDAREYAQLLGKADAALYHSKNGKNRFTFFSNLPQHSEE